MTIITVTIDLRV